MKLLLQIIIFLIGLLISLPRLAALSPSAATYGGTGRVLTSTYDHLNRLSTLAESGRNTGYGYDLNGNSVRKTLPNAEVVTTSYDGLNRAQAILGKKPNGTLSYQYLNGYDRGGNVRWVDEFYNDLPTWRDIVMDYDNADRLWHEMVADQTGNTRTTTYGYDDAHNRTSTTVANSSGGALVTSTFGFNNLNQLTSYTETGGSVTRNVTYGYDFAGNRKTRVENGATDSYGYDYEQRLVSLGKNTAGGTGAYAYSYDYRTRRVGRTEGSAVTQTVFSGGTSVQEYNGTSTTPAPASLKAEYVRGSDWGGGVGGVLYSLRSSVPSYNHYDRRGDVTEKTSNTGATTYQASYQPFGLHPNDFGSTLDRQKANTKEEDPTGLLNEGMRYRDLETGMFITRDPMGFVDGPNLYTYVRQNPWTEFDPEGLAAAYIVFPDHPITVAESWGERLKMAAASKLYNSPTYREDGKTKSKDLGHAGVLLIDPTDGKSTYYEYGRYDPKQNGKVRTQEGPVMQLDEHGNPTSESMQEAMKQLSKKVGEGGKVEKVEALVTPSAKDEYNKQKAYADELLKNPKLYDPQTNSCGTFARDTVNQGLPADQQLPTNDPRPKHDFEQQKSGTKMEYDPAKDKPAPPPKHDEQSQ